MDLCDNLEVVKDFGVLFNSYTQGLRAFRWTVMVHSLKTMSQWYTRRTS